MKKLSSMNQKCLANMPKLLDAISDTCNNLRDILEPFCERLEGQFDSCEKWVGDWCIFKDREGYSYRWLNDVKPFALWEREAAVKISYYSFFVYVGYETKIKDGREENVIYFQLIDRSSPSKIITPQLINKLCKKAPHPFRIGCNGEDNLYIEFDVKQNITPQKINDCYDNFILYILSPVKAAIRKLRRAAKE